jgi:hypothetical protein
MAGGFRNTQPVGGTLVNGIRLNTTLAVPFSANTFAIDNFASLEVALYATGSAGGAQGLLQLQFLWYDNFTSLNLVFVDTFEIVFDTVGNFGGKRSFIRTPVRGGVLQIVSNSGVNPPTNPTLNINIYGLTYTIPRTVVWCDTQDFTGTDNIVLQRVVTGLAVAAGADTPLVIGALASGPCTVAITVTVGAGTATGIFLKTFYGSLLTGLPALNLTTVGVAGDYYLFGTGFYLPRRPLLFLLHNNGPGTETITGYKVSITRDEP